jgi:6-phosphogluconolactonase
MPLAVSPTAVTSRAIRSQPYSVLDPRSTRARDARAELQRAARRHLPYISTDRTGRFLFGASYAGNLIAVHPIEGGTRVGEALQVIPVERNAHCILVDHTNKYVFVSALGTDRVFQFVFDASTGRLAANTLPVLQLKAGTGPRHMVFSNDNRFLYVLSELMGTVTTLALDAASGQLSEQGSESILPPDTKLDWNAACALGCGDFERGAAKHRQRYLGFRSASRARWPFPLRRRAHQQHACVASG